MGLVRRARIGRQHSGSPQPIFGLSRSLPDWAALPDHCWIDPDRQAAIEGWTWEALPEQDKAQLRQLSGRSAATRDLVNAAERTVERWFHEQLKPPPLPPSEKAKRAASAMAEALHHIASLSDADVSDQLRSALRLISPAWDGSLPLYFSGLGENDVVWCGEIAFELEEAAGLAKQARPRSDSSSTQEAINSLLKSWAGLTGFEPVWTESRAHRTVAGFYAELLPKLRMKAELLVYLPDGGSVPITWTPAPFVEACLPPATPTAGYALDKPSALKRGVERWRGR